MMVSLFLCLALCADEPVENKPETIPQNVREYFKRCDAAFDHMTNVLTEDIAQIEVDIKSTPPAKRAPLIRRLNKLKDELRDLKPAKVQAWLPVKPQVDDIGHLEVSTVEVVIDDKTLVVEIRQTPLEGSTIEKRKEPRIAGYAVVQQYDTKGLRRSSRIPQDAMFRVSSLEADPKKMKFSNFDKGIELQRIRQSDVMKWRDQHETERKQKANQAVVPAGDAKPKPAK